jgi:hypothetical protein
MGGKHSDPEDKVEPDLEVEEMPDPDNLRIDLTALPLTGPITLPRR